MLEPFLTLREVPRNARRSIQELAGHRKARWQRGGRLDAPLAPWPRGAVGAAVPDLGGQAGELHAEPLLVLSGTGHEINYQVSGERI